MTSCAKNPSLIELHAAVSSVHDGAPNRSARGMLKENAYYKNSKPLGFQNFTHEPRCPGSNVLQVHNRQTKLIEL